MRHAPAYVDERLRAASHDYHHHSRNDAEKLRRPRRLQSTVKSFLVPALALVGLGSVSLFLLHEPTASPPPATATPWPSDES